MGKLSQRSLPLTPRGVAAYAYAGMARLLMVQFIVAVLVAWAVMWQLYTGWFPIVDAAIERLPAKGDIRSQVLNWPGESPFVLAEGRHLALTVDLDHSHGMRALSHVQVEFGRDDFLVDLLFGYVRGRYPAGWEIAFNQSALKPMWGAWWPVVMAGAGAVAGVGVMLTWWLLSALYMFPVQLAGYFTNRNLTLLRSWQLSGAALMPGAVLMILVFVLYGLGSMDVVQLLFATGVHFVVGWIYLFLSLLFLPPVKGGSGGVNPFAKSGSKA